jgi:DNA invertase Pin-like site-specific DNA recombinase
MAGMQRAQRQGHHLGRPRIHRVNVDRARELVASGLSLRAAARELHLHPQVVKRALETPVTNPPTATSQNLASSTASGDAQITRHK